MVSNKEDGKVVKKRRSSETQEMLMCAKCVCSTVTHLCWWWLRFVNGGHPTPDSSWISVLPGNPVDLSSSTSSFLLLFFSFSPLPFRLFSFALFYFHGFHKWNLDLKNFFFKSQHRRGNLLHAHSASVGVHMAMVGGNPWLVTKIRNRGSFLMQAWYSTCLHTHGHINMWHAKFISLKQRAPLQFLWIM